MKHLLYQKNVEFGGTAIGANAGRYEIVDFEILFVTDHTILYKAPKIDADLMGFIKPYRLDVSIFLYRLYTTIIRHY